MKKAAAVLLFLTLVAGCGSAPQKTLPPGQTASADSGKASAPVEPAAPSATAPAEGAAEGADTVDVSNQPTSPAPSAGPEAPAESIGPAPTPAPQPVPSAPAPTDPSASLEGMISVAAPPADSLDASYRNADRMNQSAWEVAQAAVYYLYMDREDLAAALAPALIQRLHQESPLAGLSPAHLWLSHAGSWQEGNRFYFHLQITGRGADGKLYRAGVDVLEVSSLPGYGNILTGYAHAPWASGQSGSSVAIWAGNSPGSYLAPREVALPALPLEENGELLVPLAAASAIGSIQQVSGGRYILTLEGGTTSGEIPTVTRHGLPYAAVDDLVSAINGQSGQFPDASGSYSYHVEWQPDPGQLLFWADIQHRVS